MKISRPEQNLITFFSRISRVALILVSLIPLAWLGTFTSRTTVIEVPSPKAELWKAPDTALIPRNEIGDQIRYGRKLITQTSNYLGPQGKVKAISNGMNCQNCHLEAGTKPFGNNYASVASLYPRFRERSGSIESIERRVNDCLQRSLNGQPLDSLSKEMRAIVSFLLWLGKDVPKGEKVKGSGLIEMKFLDRKADTLNGHQLYLSKCESCHGKEGEGLMRFSGTEYLYPPLWGEHSFNTGAGLYRISNFAKYIRANMPQGASYDRPQLAEEEAWDIAAYILSLPRPRKDFPQDWPRIETKPFDFPFGPYSDNYSEDQHKYGPFKPMIPK